MGDSVKNIWGEMDEKAMSSMAGPKNASSVRGNSCGILPECCDKEPPNIIE